MITFKSSGDFSKATKYLANLKEVPIDILAMLGKYGREGVEALSSATPVDSGLTANSWSYEAFSTSNSIGIQFHNSNINDGVPIAIIIQYGHGTGTGGWVEGRDYINPAIQPIFDRMTEELWKEVTKL